MNWIEQHKALIITFLIAGIVIIGLFSFQLTKQGKLLTESYYEIEPEPESETLEEELEPLEELTGKSTNKAFNEDQEYKEMMRNFRTVSSNDTERSNEKAEETEPEEVLEENSVNQTFANSKAYALNSKETESYKKLQENLKKRLNNKQMADEHAKTKSTLTYSLKGRVLQNYKIPRYLCENGGRIIVNIKVNGAGNVTDTSVNGSSTSTDKCLIESALSYAEIVRFDPSEKSSQVGTITFLFKGKD